MATTLTAQRSTTLINDLDGDGVVDFGDTVRTVVKLTNTGGVTATGIQVNDALNGFTLVNGSVKIGPVTIDDVSTLSGNTPKTFTFAELLGNDLDADAGAGDLALMTITGVSGAVNGTVTIDSVAKTVTFTPTTGLDAGAAASFQYTSVDAQGVASASNGVVSLTVTAPVWYVDSAAAAGGDGSYARPFTSLIELNGVTGDGTTGDDVDAAGEIIFVYDRGVTYTGGIVLEANQVLHGDGTTFLVNGISVGASASNATISYSGAGITLSTNNTVDGINLVGTALGAVGITDAAGPIGTATISNVAVSGQGQIIDVDQGGTLNATLNSASSTGSTGANGGVIDVTVAGFLTVTGATSITGSHAQTGVNIGGPAAVTLSGGSVINTGAQIAISMTSAASSLSVSGGLDIDTTSGTGLFMSNGALRVASGNNTITTGTGQIVNISGGTVAAGDASFATLTSGTVASGAAVSISALGGPGTFYSGGTTVAGAGAGAGISIQNSAAVFNFAGTTTINAVSGAGVSLTGNTGAITIAGGAIGATNDPAGAGVSVSGGTGTVVVGASITKTSAGNAVTVDDHETADVTFSGNITSSTGGGGILVQNVGSGSVNFTGQSIALSTGSNSGVSLVGNTGGTVNFNPLVGGNGLDITTTIGTGLSFTGGGTLNITGSDNSITTGTGQLANLSGGALGSSGVNFLTMTSGVVATGNALNVSGLANTGNSTLNVGILTVGGASAGDGIHVDTSSSANLYFSSVTINNVSDDGIELVGSTGSFTASSGTIGNSNDPGDDGVNVAGGTGSVSIGAAITKTTAGNLVEVNGHATGNITFSGNLTATGAVNNGILVNNVTSGTVRLSGSSIAVGTSTTASAGPGISLTNNSGGTINIAPAGSGNGVDLYTGSNTGFNASGGGTISLTGGLNSVTTTTGSAVSVVDTTSTGMTWESVNTNGATFGVNLQNTGSGAFTITGTGAANSGGVIANSTTTGINLLNTGALNLTQVDITNSRDDGIYGSGVNGLNLTNVDIEGIADSGPNASNLATDRGLEISNLTGTAIVTNSTFRNTAGHTFNVYNDTGTLNLTVTGSTFSGSQVVGGSDGSASSGGGDDGMLIQANGTSRITASITGSTFSNNEGDHFQWATDGGASTGDLTFSGNTLTNAPGSNAELLGGGITISPAGASDLTFLIANNNIQGNNQGGSIDVTAVSTTDQSLVQGRIQSNIVGSAATAGSGSAQAVGISTELNGNGTMTIAVTNNQVYNWGGAYGIEVFNRTGTGAGGTLNATVRDNMVQNPTNVVPVNSAIAIRLGTSAGTDQGRVFLDIGNNNSATALASDIRVQAVASVDLYLPGYAGGVSDTAAVISYIQGRNASGGTATVTVGGAETMDFLNTAVAVPLPNAPATPMLAVVEVPGTAPAETSAWVPSPELSPLDVSAVPEVQPVGGDATPIRADTAYDAVSAAPASVLVTDTAAPAATAALALTADTLAALTQEAIARLTAAGASDAQVAALNAAVVKIADMAGMYLGASADGEVLIDLDAAGFGWFVDATPGDDAEFAGSGTRLTATDGAAVGRIDLLTVIMHELGHLAGLGDSYLLDARDSLMYGYGITGERRLPAAGQLAGATPGSVSDTAFAVGPIAVGTLPAGKSVNIVYDSTVNTQGAGLVSNQSNTAAVSSSSAVGSAGYFPSVNSNSETLAIDTLTLGDRVFRDVNVNGVFDAAFGDVGVSGVTLTLFADTNANGSYDAGDTQVATTTTDASGIYSFAGLAPGDYIVRVDAANFTGAGALVGRIATAQAADPDNNVNNDSNAGALTGGASYSGAITLAYNTEPTPGTGNDTNNTLDLGFRAPNVAPTIGNLQGNTVTFTEGPGEVILDAGSDLTVVDADSVDFDGGTLTIRITNKVATEDGISFSVGTDAAGAGVNASAGVFYLDGVAFGTVGAGGLGVDRVVTFNANATPAAVQALMRTVNYYNDNQANPSTVVRNVSYTLTDGDGGTTVVTSSVNVVAVNDAPFVNVSGGTLRPFTEGTPIIVDSGISVLDGDNTTLASATVTIRTNYQSGADVLALTATSGIGNIAASFNVATGALTLTSAGATATLAEFQAALRSVTYNNTSDAPTALNRQIGFAANDGTATGLVNTRTVSVTPVDDLPVAFNDTGTVAENATVSVNVLGNDTDPDGGPKAVVTVAGQAIADGGSVTLASGATVTLTAGELVYNPNGKFAYLVNTATKGANPFYADTASDSFGYAVNGGSAATVTVTVTGADAVGELRGTAGNNTVTGTAAAETFNVTQGGDDDIDAQGGNDGIYFGASFGSGDHVNGGAGTGDTLVLQGDYSAGLLITASMLENTEVVVAKAGSSYNFTQSGNLSVDAGALLTFYASELGVANSFSYQAFATTQTVRVFGGAGTDTIRMGDGNDGVYFGPGKYNPLTDTADGGAGVDQIAFDGVYPSLVLDGARLANFETVVLVAGPAGSPSSFGVTVNADFVPAGEKSIYGAALTTALTVNASAVGAAGSVRIYGGTTGDTLTGGAGADWFWANTGADTLTGGAGADVFVVDTAAQSNGAAYDTITDFAIGSDLIDVTRSYTAVAKVGAGQLSSGNFEIDLAAAVGGQLGVNGGVLFTPTSGDFGAGAAFLVLDGNGIAGYQAGEDIVIRADGLFGATEAQALGLLI